MEYIRESMWQDYVIAASHVRWHLCFLLNETVNSDPHVDKCSVFISHYGDSKGHNMKQGLQLALSCGEFIYIHLFASNSLFFELSMEGTMWPWLAECWKCLTTIHGAQMFHILSSLFHLGKVCSFFAISIDWDQGSKITVALLPNLLVSLGRW